MYHTCLYCNHDLGRNEVIELLPIGRRLAFDAAQGRLWVICRSCARWNLVPFDSRLETIDRCEARFRDARMRYSTDHIGIARLPEGLELVRIGSAQRPEFAAWRYGDRFASRRRRNAMIGAAVGVAAIGAAAGVHALIGAGLGTQFLFQGYSALWHRRVAARFVPEGDREPLTLTARDIRAAHLSFRGRTSAFPHGSQGWTLELPERRHAHGWVALSSAPSNTIEFSGDQLPVALSHVLPALSGLAGSRKQVADALALVAEHQTIGEQINRSVEWSRPLSKVGDAERLALEMIANEASERRYLEGELKLLERQWKAADGLARVADDLAVSDDVRAQLGERNA